MTDFAHSHDPVDLEDLAVVESTTAEARGDQDRDDTAAQVLMLRGAANALDRVLDCARHMPPTITDYASAHTTGLEAIRCELLAWRAVDRAHTPDTAKGWDALLRLRDIADQAEDGS